MLNKLKINNFKPFGEIDSVRLAPITLIYGPNSSGKSSIIQSLLMMSQTINGRKSRDQIELITNGQSIDLGSFSSVIHNHNQKKIMEFKYEIFDPLFDTTYSATRNMIFLPLKSILLRFSVISASSKKSVPILDSFGFELYDKNKNSKYFQFDRQEKSKAKGARTDLENIELDDDTDHGDDYTRSELFYTPNKKEAILDLLEILEGYYQLEPAANKWKHSNKVLSQSEINIEKVARQEAIIEALSKIELRSDRSILGSSPFLPTKIETHEGNVGSISKSPIEILPKILREIDRRLVKALGGLSYLGPLRSHPARYYSTEGLAANSVGAQGEQVVQILYNDMRRKGKTSIIKSLNSCCSDFGIPYSFEIKNIGDEVTGDILVLSLIDTRTLVRVGPADVGFGIGQLLPILIEGLLINEEELISRIVCVEQPEIHLHPKLQASFADFFIRTSCGLHQNDTSRSTRGGVQWILETHSEALMVRIQRRIREKKISHEDVSVLYVNPQGEKGSKVLELRLDEDGEFIDLWPDGFFVDSLADMMGGR
jgi:AAA15 family ATPase/GTPase